MNIFSLADLHLSFGVPDKKMDIFGENWTNHPEKIKANWNRLIKEEDLVLLPGDISWGMHPEEALKDLEWIDSLPGTKVMIRGNHDYWWSSLKKLEQILPPSIHIIQNNTYCINKIAIGGVRLWDTPEYSFGNYITYRENKKENILTKEENPADAKKIFNRELIRLEMSLKLLPKDNVTRIAMIHYPPIGAHLNDSAVSFLLEKYKVSICVFGHLHNVLPNALPFGTKNGVKYILTSADYLDFCPINIGVSL